MVKDCTLLVFTDLDGTLIDHDSYSWEPARPALEAIKKIGAGLVLSSSKTPMEIAELRTELDAEQWPAIVENGAGILPPFADGKIDPAAYQTLRQQLDELPNDLRMNFVGFGDLSVEEVSKNTGLGPADAALAKKRCFSEPGIWLGSESQKREFLERLAQKGITAKQGGRFLTLSFGTDKVDQVRELVASYAPKVTIALGDAPNDISMLEAADYGVVVANPKGAPLPELQTEADGRIIRTQDPGPVGWNTAILQLLEKLNIS